MSIAETETQSLEIIETDLAPYDETDDGNEHLAHIVNPPNNLHIYQPGMKSADIVYVARMNGIEVVALCGYRFVPKRNPEDKAACQACFDVASEIMKEFG